ncbi:unnamed protein product [Coffea canephora]|uniref:Uncharacterized protein n=1 Tax=Coffea canephora TaxID=49390 RepID=A0A068V6Q2_COFCA|nr:unnamed protein product [Coffea canephora]
MAYKADFVIDSLRVGDISFYALLLFDNVTSEIQLLKAKTLVVDGNENVIKAQTPTKHLRNASSQEMSMLSGACLQVSSQASISTMNKAVVDLKDQEQAIIDQLIGGSMQLDVISIVGMPGLGKTFLAQKVYHHPSVTSHFHILAWCCISQTYCKKDLLLGMLSCIDPKAQYSEMNEDDLAHKLCNHLRKQKYLIVLDDIWDIEAWNALKISFPDDTNGSRILLTSRHHGIIGKPHYLRPLDEEESWELLQKRLLTREEGYPPELNVLARQIAKHCNGLPLSIVIISGILLTLDQVGWEEVAERLNSNKKIGATEQCKSILELSYIHLPEHLKPCLIYFAAFSEDQEISVQRLIFLWIAEGFVKKSESENLEKIAEGYIMALINRSLVMVGQQRSIGGVKTCRIHDLLHVFCLRKAKDQNFLQFMRGYDVLHKVEEPYNLCRLSIYSQPKHFVKSRIFCPRMRSLLYSSRGGGSHEVLDHLSFIFHLKLLRVLDLGQISLGSAFPTELSLLVELRYLAVLGWFKDNIPSSLEKLSKLETLFVTTYYSDVGLLLFLDTLMKMQKLRHLHVCGALIDLRLANDNIEYSSILYSLDTFSTVKLYVGQSMEKVMGKFPNIRELKCCLQQSEESSDDSNMIVAMDSLSQLESLKLVLGKVASHLIEFHLPLNIKKLTVEDFSFRTIATIAKLPNLQVLKLLRQADGANEWDMEGMDEEEFFPELKFLKLEDLSMVTWRGSGLHFPSLEKLVLEGCKELEELPSCLWETLTLQLIAVHRCLYSAGDVVRDIQKQQIDYGNKYLKILISEEIEDTLSWSDGDYEG